ncbi:MAG: DNA primase [Muribaculaceae bacterium]|nr:DNA primase [Muribaculaceae bacterium]
MIDKATVDQILDTADIVDVVSDFVSLRRRGANWVGLCPFHNDRNPSFYVSRAKGICKCFSCGKGGSPVNFIMEHEQLSYYEALKYLANKYHIEVDERELTDEERVAQSEREAMLMVNEWACQFFESQLRTEAGEEIGLAYFYERGFSEATIKRFRLGYSPDDRTALYRAAIGQGFNRELLFKLGLCKDDGHGGGFDFFRGRVMFPIFNVAGKVIAFGGRTLKNDPAKYFNSPDSLVYNKKDSTMYGLFQAKREIAKKDKCFIVEGYADVISMHQAGFENVIASSGTALTEGHIHLIHRFTNNVTELFDGDAAGIHAALRGIDMLLAEGLNIKVLLLPEGDDPDSFSRKHNSTEMQRYIDDNEDDFIRFKTRILLQGAEKDPIKRSAAITEVVKSIAVIPSPITRSVYAKECASRFGIDEEMLLREIQKYINKNREENYKRRERERRRMEAGLPANEEPLPTENNSEAPTPVAPTPSKSARLAADASQLVLRQEENIIRYIVKYGMCYLCDTEYDDGVKRPTSVVEFIYNEMSFDSMQFTSPTYAKIYEIALDSLKDFYQDLANFKEVVQAEADEQLVEELQKIDARGHNADSLKKEEEKVQARITANMASKVNEFSRNYLERRLCSHLDDEIRLTALDMVSEKYQLSKIHTQYATIATEMDRLLTLVPEALYNWKNALLDHQIKQIQSQLKQSTDPEAQKSLLEQLQQLYVGRSEIAKYIGERVVNPN